MATRKIVFFLGAGASKAFGLPLTSELLPDILKRIKKYSLFDDTTARNDLKNFLSKLMPQILTYSNKKNRSLPLVTDILSMCDYMMINNIEPWPLLKSKSLSYYRKLIVDSILEVLDRKKFRRQENKTVEDLARLIFEANHNPTQNSFVSVISTNYDCRLEYELFNFHGEWGNQKREELEEHLDFGTVWRSPFEDLCYNINLNPRYRIYKLHGSTNWLKCNVCGYIFINTYTDIYMLEEEPGEASECHCSKSRLRSHIIAPSLVRDIRDPNLLNIWKQATEVLREADDWVIVGYSLPPEDIAIKSMLVRAFNARSTKPRIQVVQFEPDLITKGSDVASLNKENMDFESKLYDNYNLLFNHRHNAFHYFPGGLEAFIPELQTEYLGPNSRDKK